MRFVYVYGCKKKEEKKKERVYGEPGRRKCMCCIRVLMLFICVRRVVGLCVCVCITTPEFAGRAPKDRGRENSFDYTRQDCSDGELHLVKKWWG